MGFITCKNKIFKNDSIKNQKHVKYTQERKGERRDETNRKQQQYGRLKTDYIDNHLSGLNLLL